MLDRLCPSKRYILLVIALHEVWEFILPLLCFLLLMSSSNLKNCIGKNLLPDLGMKGTRRFEQSVSKQVNEGKLTVRGVDYCLACRHPAECAVCFLIASIWFLRELKQKASQAPKNTQSCMH